MGHLGTLDPLAEGVLPVAIGSARRLIRFFKTDKVYIATIRLGLTTDTDDIEGETVSTTDAGSLTRDGIDDALNGFIGEIEQVPPRYSAAMSGGVRAYKRARMGDDFDLKPRTVLVRDIVINDWNSPDLLVRFTVSQGTYIRSIARDLGEILGVGGCLAALKRESDGPFHSDNAVDVVDLEKEGVPGIEERLLPPDFILDGWERVELNDERQIAFSQGKILSDIELPRENAEEYFAVYDTEGFVGVGERVADGGLKAYKVIRTTD